MKTPTPDGRAVDARRGGYTHTIVEDNGPLTAAQFEAGMGIMLDRFSDLCEAREQALQDAVRLGVHNGLRSAAADEKLMNQYWRGGFDELKKHAATDTSQWVGRRVLTWLLVGLATLAATLLIKYGR